MNQAELQKTSEGYSIATVGDIASFEGKAFVKDILNTTSMELSFGTLAPGCTVPFFHHHNQNEEVNVVLSGEGVFILDGKEEPHLSFLYAEGVLPVCDLKKRTKCWGYSKPRRLLIIVMVSASSLRSCLA